MPGGAHFHPVAWSDLVKILLWLVPVFVVLAFAVLVSRQASRPEVEIAVTGISFAGGVPLRVHRANGTIDHFVGQLDDCGGLTYPAGLVLAPGDEVRVHAAVLAEQVQRQTACRFHR
jgi:hypothetical protein